MTTGDKNIQNLPNPEIPPKAEQKEQINKYEGEFKDYAEKLKQAGLNELIGKIHGDFLLSGNLKQSLENRKKDSGLSEFSIDAVYQNLANNTEISPETQIQIQKEINEFNLGKNIDFKLEKLIPELNKIAEQKEDQSLDEFIESSINIKKTGTNEQKQDLITKLENRLKEENNAIETEFNPIQETENTENSSQNPNLVDYTVGLDNQKVSLDTEETEDILNPENSLEHQEFAEIGQNIEPEDIPLEKNDQNIVKNENIDLNANVNGQENSVQNKESLISKAGNFVSKMNEDNSGGDFESEKKPDNGQTVELDKTEVGDKEFTKEDLKEDENGEVYENIEITEQNYAELNGEFYPILDNLKNYGEIDKEQFKQINEKLANTPKQDKQSELLSFVEGLPKSEARQNIIDKFANKVDKIDEKNFDKTDFFADAKGKIGFSKHIGGLEVMLAENYIFLPEKGKDKGQNAENSLNLTCEIVKEKICAKNTKEFRQNNSELIGNIEKADNVDSKYKLLKNLYKMSLKEDAIHGATETRKQSEAEVKEELREEYEEILAEIKKIELKPLKTDEEIAKLTKFKEDKTNIEKEAKIFEGQIMAGGEKDVVSDKNEA